MKFEKVPSGLKSNSLKLYTVSILKDSNGLFNCKVLCKLGSNHVQWHNRYRDAQEATLHTRKYLLNRYEELRQNEMYWEKTMSRKGYICQYHHLQMNIEGPNKEGLFFCTASPVNPLTTGAFLRVPAPSFKDAKQKLTGWYQELLSRELRIVNNEWVTK